MSEENFQTKHKVVYYETDLTGKLSIPMLFNVAILASTRQNDTLGQTDEKIHAQNLGWVVLQYELKINERPKEGDEIIVGTHAQEYNSYFAVRNFWIDSIDGKRLVEIKSVFALIDMQQRKMVRIPSDMMEAYQATKVKHIDKIQAPIEINFENNTNQKNYHVRYLDIDSNLHVNNAQYFDWLLDPIDWHFLNTHELKTLNIKYANEIRYGDEVMSYYEQVNELTTRHQIKVGDTINTEAEITWVKN